MEEVPRWVKGAVASVLGFWTFFFLTCNVLLMGLPLGDGDLWLVALTGAAVGAVMSLFGGKDTHKPPKNPSSSPTS